jgi:hypothetical protein
MKSSPQPSPASVSAPIKRASEFAGVGCALQGFGLLAPVVGILFGGPIGFGVGCVVCVILLLLGSSKSIRLLCGHCGNPVFGKGVKICPACKGKLHWKGTNWWLVLVGVGACLALLIFFGKGVPEMPDNVSPGCIRSVGGAGLHQACKKGSLPPAFTRPHDLPTVPQALRS